MTDDTPTPTADENKVRVQKAFDAAFREMYPRAGDSWAKRRKVAQVLEAFLHAAELAEGDTIQGRTLQRWKWDLRTLP